MLHSRGARMLCLFVVHVQAYEEEAAALRSKLAEQQRRESEDRKQVRCMRLCGLLR